MSREAFDMTVSGIAVCGLRKQYGSEAGPVLDGLNFGLPKGETLSVIGPSGCGKSTLLYLLAGLERPDAGSVLLHGRDVFSEVRARLAAQGKDPSADFDSPRIAFILQDYGLFPWKTVADNLTLPLELHGVQLPERRAAVADMLAELGLSGYEDRYPVQLSGGQRQRVAVGRALIARPDILLMDEPFSSLDALTREHLQSTVLDLWRKRGPTCVLVTHSVPEAVFLGTHIMVLRGSPARCVLWLDNPCFGDATCREQVRYFDLVRTVHAALAGAESRS